MKHVLANVLVVVCTLAIAASAPVAKTKIKTQHDKSFAFAGLKTYAWHPDGAGEFKMLQNTDDDPKQLRDRFEPVIKQAVERALAARGFVPATAGTPDLQLNYYMLIGPGTSSQFAGQFVAGVPEWGLPVFADGATTAFNAFEQGSLILDISSPAQKSTVWRGIAQAEIHRTNTAAERDKRIQEAIGEMLKKFPPKK